MTISSDASPTTPHDTPAWPRSTTDLTDTTQCPACHTPLGSALCNNCGLNLSHPLAHTLAALSTEIAEQFSKRSELIEQIRRETDAAEQPMPGPMPMPVPPVVLGQPAVPEQPPVALQPVVAPPPVVPEQPSVAAPYEQPASAPPAQPRRSGVQLTLLVTGIVLVSVFAIFFMVYAFINYGLVWRAVIIGFVTLATLVAASLLRGRNLTASAEGIAALAVVLLLLDVFAIRANGMLGADRSDGSLYWGVALLMLTTTLWLWHALARVRTARVAASILALPGTLLLATGIGGQIFAIEIGAGVANNIYAGMLATAAAGLLHAVLGRRTTDVSTDTALVERIILIALTAPPLLLSALIALVIAPSAILGATPATLGVAAVAAAHWFAAARRRRDSFDTGVARAFAGATGALTVIAFAVLPSRIEWTHSQDLIGVLPAVPALLVAIVWFLVARPALPARPLGTRSSTIGSLTVAAIMLAPPAFIALSTALGRAGQSLALLRTAPFDSVIDVTMLRIVSVAILAGAVIIVWVVLASLRRATRATPVLAVTAATVALTATALIPVLWALLLGWLLIGAAGLLLARRLPNALRPAAHTAAIGGITLAWIAGWASPASWPITSVLAIGALLLVRWRTASAPQRTASAPLRIGATMAAALLALVAATAAADQLVADVTAGAFGCGIMGALLALGAGLAPGPRTSLDRRLVFWGGAATATLVALREAGTAAVTGGSEPSPLLLTLSAGTLAATLVWQLLPANRTLRIESSTAAVLVAPALAWLAVSTLDIAGVTDAAPTTITAAAVLVAAASAALFIAKPAARLPLDAGAAGVGVIGLLIGLTTREHVWLVLLFAAVSALILAISRDGIIGSASARKHIGWVALTLSTAALWTQLIEQSVTAVEAYVLPLAAALLVIAALTARAERQRGAEHQRDATAPTAHGSAWLTLAALLIAIVPLALSSFDGHELRAALTLSASAVLLLGAVAIGAVTPSGGKASGGKVGGGTSAGLARHLRSAAVVGAIGVVIVTAIRAFVALSKDGENLELWLIPGVGTLIAAGIITTLRSRGANVLGSLLVGGGLALLAVAEVAAIYTTASSNDTLRAATMVAVLSLAHTVGMLVLRSTAIAWASAGIASVTALATLAVVESAELVTAPLALALLITGAAKLAGNPALRSWPWLAPGTALLLLPSLLVTIGDRPLWRLVGLGIAALAITVIAVVMRLQAPFIIGVGVLLIHGIATLQPQIRAVYELADWYVWAGIGGVLLIALAIRYERRIRDLKKAVSSIRSLR